MSTNTKSKLGYFFVAFCSFYLGMELAMEGTYAFLSHVISVIVFIYLIGAFVQWRQKRKVKKEARRKKWERFLDQMGTAAAAYSRSQPRTRYSRPSTARPVRSGMERTLADAAEATGTLATAPEAPRPSPSSAEDRNHARCLARSIGEGLPCNNPNCKDCWPAPVEEDPNNQ